MKCIMLAAVAVFGAWSVCAAGSVIKASSFGWSEEDATKCLQAAINSGAKVVRVDRQRGDWIVSRTIHLRSDQEVVFEDGVVVQAKRGCFKGITDSLFRAKSTTNTLMRGEGKAVLRMCMPDYLDEKQYKAAEWRHCISTLSPVNFTVRNLTVADSGGDGVYVNGCKNMLVEDVVSSGNNRQGISVISVDGLTVRNCVFKNTRGALPECGIDIEPHASSCQIRNVLIEKCSFEDNNCHGIAMNLSGLSDKSRDVSITFRDCTATGNRHHGVWAILGRNTHKGPKGKIVFENVKTSGNGSEPLSLENLASGTHEIVFRNCDFDGMKSRRGIKFTTADDFGDVTFENTILRIPETVEAVKFIGATGSGIAKLEGKLAVVTEKGTKSIDLGIWGKKFASDPQLRTFDQRRANFNIKSLIAAKPNAKISAEDGWSPVIRGRATLIVRAPSKGEHKLYFKTVKIGRKWSQDGGSLTVYDAAGTTHDQATIKPYGEVTEYVLKAQGPNVYTINVSVGGFSAFTYKSSFPGSGILCRSAVDFFATKRKSLYFPVPKGSKEIKIEFMMSSGEPMTGRLVDPSGKVVASVEKACARSILAAKFPETDCDALWCLKADDFLDDGNVRIGGDAIPVASPCAEGAFLYRQK